MIEHAPPCLFGLNRWKKDEPAWSFDARAAAAKNTRS